MAKRNAPKTKSPQPGTLAHALRSGDALALLAQLATAVLADERLKGFSATTFDRHWDTGEPTLCVVDEPSGVWMSVVLYSGAEPGDTILGHIKVVYRVPGSDKRLRLPSGDAPGAYLHANDGADLLALLHRELGRARAAQEAMTGATTVPQLGFTLSPKRREELSLRLQTGNVATLAPSSYGTGYSLCAFQGSLPRYAKPAPAEVAQYFGVKRLWMATFDHD